jgi:hypothetical protein
MPYNRFGGICHLTLRQVTRAQNKGKKLSGLARKTLNLQRNVLNQSPLANPLFLTSMANLSISIARDLQSNDAVFRDGLPVPTSVTLKDLDQALLEEDEDGEPR